MKTITKILSAIILGSVIFTQYSYADSTSIINQSITDISNTDIVSISLNKEISNEISKLNSDVYKDFEIKILKNENLVLENGVWYTYIYKNYLSSGKGAVPNKNDLNSAGIDTEKDILLLDENIGVGFVKDYEKVKLISDKIISGISNKKEFLKQLADDKKYLHDDTDELFIKLKNETLELTKGLSDGRKVLAIYDYILKNTSYSDVFDVNNKEIFSGIYTYKNNDGICAGYSKLDLYMLSFAGISGVEVVRGTVINTKNFLEIGHAWIKIGNKYFDPTFDDPIGNTKARTFKTYKYFGLPEDLFYANRYDYGTMPKSLETTTLSYRQDVVKENLKNLAEKYKNNNYNLLATY